MLSSGTRASISMVFAARAWSANIGLAAAGLIRSLSLDQTSNESHDSDDSGVKQEEKRSHCYSWPRCKPFSVLQTMPDRSCLRDHKRGDAAQGADGAEHDEEGRGDHAASNEGYEPARSRGDDGGAPELVRFFLAEPVALGWCWVKPLVPSASCTGSPFVLYRRDAPLPTAVLADVASVALGLLLSRPFRHEDRLAHRSSQFHHTSDLSLPQIGHQERGAPRSWGPWMCQRMHRGEPLCRQP